MNPPPRPPPRPPPSSRTSPPSTRINLPPINLPRINLPPINRPSSALNCATILHFHPKPNPSIHTSIYTPPTTALLSNPHRICRCETADERREIRIWP